MSHEYAFDVTVMAALRVNADTEQQGRDKLAELLNCASTNFGELDGQPVVGEASLCGRASLYEVDGEPYTDEPSRLDAMEELLRGLDKALQSDMDKGDRAYWRSMIGKITK